MESIAFALRSEYEETFEGGLLATADGDIDVGQELEDGDGTIVIDAVKSPATVDLLDNYPALKRVPAPEKSAKKSASAPKGESK